MAAGDAAPKRAALSDEMLLADELVEARRPHPRREGLLLGRRLEERLRTSASGLRPCGRHGASLGGGHAGQRGAFCADAPLAAMQSGSQGDASGYVPAPPSVSVRQCHLLRSAVGEPP
jgi:hypothetical protein